MHELVGLPYSPWTERARWSLDHHGIEHRFTKHLILLSEPSLRLRTKKFTGKLTVPVLFRDGQPPLFDSREIAEYADAQSGRSPLFVVERRNEIDQWLETIERALEAGRNLVTSATMKNLDATADLAPRALPQALKVVLAKSGQPLFALKYGLHRRDDGADKATIAAFVEGLAQALAQKSPYLLGEFSFVDIAAATALQMVKPVDQKYIRISDAMRSVWTQRELAERYPQVLAWRDELYARHRASRAK